MSAERSCGPCPAAVRLLASSPLAGPAPALSPSVWSVAVCAGSRGTPLATRESTGAAPSAAAFSGRWEEPLLRSSAESPPVRDAGSGDRISPSSSSRAAVTRCWKKISVPS